MKKIFVPLVLLMAVMFGSLGSAQSNGFGIYSGYPTWVGVQTQTADLRLGIGLGFYGIAGSVDYMLGESFLDTGSSNSDLRISWYYGAGLNAAFGLGGGLFGTGIYADLHGLLGLEFDIRSITGMSFYTELQLGAQVLPGFSVGYGGRGGIIFRP